MNKPLYYWIYRYCNAMGYERYHPLRAIAFQLQLAIESGTQEEIEAAQATAEDAYDAELVGYNRRLQ